MPLGGFVIFDDFVQSSNAPGSLGRCWVDFKRAHGVTEKLLAIDWSSSFFRKVTDVKVDCIGEHMRAIGSLCMRMQLNRWQSSRVDQRETCKTELQKPVSITRDQTASCRQRVSMSGPRCESVPQSWRLSLTLRLAGFVGKKTQRESQREHRTQYCAQVSCISFGGHGTRYTLLNLALKPQVPFGFQLTA